MVGVTVKVRLFTDIAILNMTLRLRDIRVSAQLIQSSTSGLVLKTPQPVSEDL